MGKAPKKSLSSAGRLFVKMTGTMNTLFAMRNKDAFKFVCVCITGKGSAGRFLSLKKKKLLEEEAAHAAPHTLPVKENVELVDELVQVVTGFGYRSQVSLQKNVIVLL